ncbi:HET-domain-containing protein [Microthyrium microscopicum]|uniref:HET-domain-containing protein n=1 Tax=Microthyrium microscopicum TaxID=703497 RepID=A0A6A6TXN4_9PEZI|nr:HET-domain-containing protein [Microthyrium microscopicum]
MEISADVTSPNAETIKRFNLLDRKCRAQHGKDFSSTLCTVCAALDLDTLLAPAKKQSAGRMRDDIQLGSLSQLQDCSSHCTFCKYVLEQVPSVIGPEAMPPKYVDYKEFEFEPYPPPVDHWTYAECVPELNEIIVMLRSMRGDTEECQDLPMIKLKDYLKDPAATWIDMVIHSGGPGSKTPTAGMAITCTKFVPCSNGLVKQALSGRLIPAEVDYSELKGHLNLCLDKHEECFLRDVDATAVEKYLWLIDIANRRVVLANSSTDYAALSYVWGAARRDYTHFQNIRSEHSESWPDIEMLVDENEVLSTELPQDLPATISDAIEFCSKLGIEYLWVDSICIDQESKKMKDYLIGRMDSIYMRAKITIIAAAGDDANAGLPGVRSGTRKESRRITDLQGVNFTTARPFAKRLIADSTWWKRAWTFQEGWLSPRCFIFTDQEVLYCCTRSTHRESLYSYDPLVRNGLADRLFMTQEIGFPTGIGQVSKTPKFRTLFNNVMTLYHKRQLTFEGDRINAIHGCVTVISERFGISNWYGMPMQWGRGAGALIWRHMKPAKRIHLEFPSYSWASWNAEPFYIDYITQVHDTPDMFEIDLDWDIVKSLGAPAVLFKGEVAKLYIKPDQSNEWRLDEQKHPKQPSWLSTECYLDDDLSVQERDSISSGPSEFLGLAKGYSAVGGQNVVIALMIERKETHVVRRSIICVTDFAWMRAVREDEELVLL